VGSLQGHDAPMAIVRFHTLSMYEGSQTARSVEEKRSLDYGGDGRYDDDGDGDDVQHENVSPCHPNCCGYVVRVGVVVRM
jgi:hypothetical protein